MTFCSDHDLPLDRLVGFGSDEAAVMVGRKGVATLLKERVSKCTFDFELLVVLCQAEVSVCQIL